MRFTEDDVPSLVGTTALVTGASSGLGLENARALARRGAHVILATRDPDRTAMAMTRIVRAVPQADLEHLPLDLADLSSIRQAVAAIHAQHPRLDIMLANAGVMGTPAMTTTDGFELQMGVNHLGHAALIAGLLPLLGRARAPRIVVVTSEMARLGRVDPMRLGEVVEPHRPWRAYAASKLANLLYAFALTRHLDRVAPHIVVATAHPGYAATDLQTRGPSMAGTRRARVRARMLGAVTAVVAQSAAQGALPQLRAATDPEVASGSAFGPAAGMRGAAIHVDPPARARDQELADALFRRTEALIGIEHAIA